ncbi:MAG: DMT family transporter [Notoacmeibacter sp.]|nr:DMT family transporter [Notoacmeibacter sp.]
MQNRVPARFPIAVVVMIVTPLLFSTNLVFGRDVVREVAPFTLAFIRWATVGLVLTPFVIRDWVTIGTIVRHNRTRIAVLGFLGMFVCGAVVYVALTMTTATNATLIYTSSSVIIIIMETVFAGRRMKAREAAGSAIAFAGVATIVLRGDPSALLSMQFNPGDLLILVAAFSWAGYSLIYRSGDLARLPNMALFSLVATAGSLTILPFAAYEVASGIRVPWTLSAWQGIGGIVVLASLLAFSGFQYGVRNLGPSLTGIFMYMLPPYGVVLAVLLLGESFHGFHAAGILLVTGGIVMATFPLAWLRQRFGGVSADRLKDGKGFQQPE